MNAVDATSRTEAEDTGEPPSLLTIILDTNPHAWALISDSLPLSKAVANLLVFINAHLAINPANRVAVLASHVETAEWLYPSPHNDHPERSTSESSTLNGHGVESGLGGPVQPPDDANKYRPFAHVEHAISTNLRRLLHNTTASSLQGTTSTMIAGALTRALAYISKKTTSTSGSSTSQTTFNYSDPSSLAGSNDISNPAGAANSSTLSPRLLVITLSPDAPEQYIPIMNSIFASQRLSIPLDILPLTPSNKTFLQQAADATQGIYLPLTTAAAHAGFLQYLMFAYLPDLPARQHLISPGSDSGVDFRAACFCHRRIVDLGFVCSICLSIFCEPVLEEGKCMTCSSFLSLGDYGRKPMVLPSKKKKKKKTGGTTPASGVGTPLA